LSKVGESKYFGASSSIQAGANGRYTSRLFTFTLILSLISGKDASRYADKGEIPTHEIKELIEDSLLRKKSSV